MEHIGRQLAAATALHSMNAPLAATSMFTRLQPHATEVLAWALEAPSHAAARAYAGVAWGCMPVLAPRLDIGQRQAFCEVGKTLSLAHLRAPLFAASPALRLQPGRDTATAACHLHSEVQAEEIEGPARTGMRGR